MVNVLNKGSKIECIIAYNEVISFTIFAFSAKWLLQPVFKRLQ